MASSGISCPGSSYTSADWRVVGVINSHWTTGGLLLASASLVVWQHGAEVTLGPLLLLAAEGLTQDPSIA